MPNKYLVTGVAGFIGMHTTLKLLNRGEVVVGIDNLSDYYDVSLKQARLNQLKNFPRFYFHQVDIAERTALDYVFSCERPSHVIHLAAQAGVRYSITHPHVYINSNIQGFLHILECCRHFDVRHLVYASSSSVYGGNKQLPFSETQPVDHPISLYAATKKSNELMAHTYSHLYKIPTTGLRFFTVYGPWGRPDMALFLFTQAMLAHKPIDVFNHGKMIRDFTYIDDIVEGVIRCVDKPAIPSVEADLDYKDPSQSDAPFLVFNIGNSHPTPLMDYIKALEEALDIEAQKNYLPMQAGDVLTTSADVSKLASWIDFKPNTPVKVGVKKFADWYRDFYGV